MKNKIQASLKKHRKPIIQTAVTSVVSVVTYSLICKQFGYYMSHPGIIDGDKIYNRSITGTMLVSTIKDAPEA